jgi:hypothetical protein
MKKIIAVADDDDESTSSDDVDPKLYSQLHLMELYDVS